MFAFSLALSHSKHSFALGFSLSDLKPHQLFGFAPQAGQSAHFPLPLTSKKKMGEGNKQTKKENPNPKTVRNWHLHQTHCHDGTIKKPKPTRRLLDVKKRISWNSRQLPRRGIQDEPWELRAAPPSAARVSSRIPIAGTAERPSETLRAPRFDFHLLR